jgi:hypothetical protein
LVLVAQLLFGQMIELVVPSRWLSGLLPKLICAPDDLNLGWSFHFLPFESTRPARTWHRAGLGVELSGGSKLRQ